MKLETWNVELDIKNSREIFPPGDFLCLEAPPGFEPGIKALQASALPLGDGATYRLKILFVKPVIVKVRQVQYPTSKVQCQKKLIAIQI